TFEDVADNYFKHYCINLEANTISGYMSIYTRQNGLRAFFGKMKLKQIDTNTVQLYISQLNAHGSSPKTISNTIGLLSTIMKHCVALQYINRNPVDGTTLPKKIKNLEVKAYTPEQVQQLLAISQNNHFIHTVIALGTLAGLRRGEMAALTWDRVNLDDNPSIKIKESKYHVSKTLGLPEYSGIKTPKTTASIRTIPIPDTLVRILKQEKRHYAECKLRYGARFKDSNCVLFKEDGSSYEVCTLSNGYTKFMRKHPEIPYCTLHQLRHTFASMLASNNTPIKDVQELLGHSDISTTMNVYTHGFEESKRTAITELNRLISG
ncbi:MAG: site-specific integrase, partial [Peptococcaceae bacterium]|nr:site-specific integrase [Peptococcaceae bacterium]